MLDGVHKIATGCAAALYLIVPDSVVKPRAMRAALVEEVSPALGIELEGAGD